MSVKLHPAGLFVHAGFAISLAWSIAGVWNLTRTLGSGMLPGDAGASTGLEFCRSETERQLRYIRGALLWSFGPIALAIAMLALSLAANGFVLRRSIPLMLVAGVWVIAYLVTAAQHSRDLVRELNELAEIEKANRP